MREPIIFVVNCGTLGPINLETRNWWSERDGNTEVIHYRGKCKCGNEHVGFTLPRAA